MKRLVEVLLLVALAVVAWCVGWLLEPAVNAWLLTLRGVDAPEPST